MMRVAWVILVAIAISPSHACQSASIDDLAPADQSTQVPNQAQPGVSSSGGIRNPSSGSGTQNTPKAPGQSVADAPRKPSVPAPKSAIRTWNTAGAIAQTPRVTTNRAQPVAGTMGTPRVPQADVQVKRSQGADGSVIRVQVPDIGAIPQPATATPDPGIGGQSISLQTALYGALTSNPDLVTLRAGNPLVVSAEAVEVARHFPTTLNPTLWIDFRPITLIPNGTFGSGAPGGHSGLPGANGFYHYGQDYIYVSLRQPIEFGHQTTHRYRIAKAAYDQQSWIVVQAELTALVQTYRLFQTAAYRREKYRLARELADFNDHLLETLLRRMEATPTIAADVSLARVESRATRQQIKATRQDYLTALADLRNQVGIPDQAGAIEPFGEFELPAYIPPLDEQTMVNEALQNRPDIRAANAQVAGTHSAIDLARGDRIPTPIFGPQYAMDEAGVQYVGFVLIAPIPIWNNGKPLVLQREAEHRRAIVAFEEAQQRAVAQVRAAVAKWNGATELVNESTSLSADLRKEITVLDRLFEAGQTDLTKLMQARQRLIQLENSRLDALWQATQSQADLLLALGIPSMIQSMLARAQADATPAPGQPGPSSHRAPATPPANPGLVQDAAMPAPAPARQ